MSFANDLNRFATKVEKRSRAIHQISTEEVQRSVVEGSSITGAPGQPVQSGNLKGSYVPVFEGPFLWRTSSAVIYAPVIEEGFGMTLRSTVGGFHSIKLTRGGWQRIVDFAQREVVRD